MKSTVTYRLADGAMEAQLRDRTVTMDTAPPFGKDQAPSPKELLLASIGGCTVIDVALVLKKHKIAFDSLRVHLDATPVAEHPKVFPQIDLVFEVTGADVPSERMIEAVELSMTKYCGVSAMVSKVSPLYYTVRVNEEIVHRGEAKFW